MRDEREKAEKAEKLAKVAAAQAAKKAAEAAAAAAAETGAPGNDSAAPESKAVAEATTLPDATLTTVDAEKEAKRAAIAAAMARAKAQRDAMPAKNTEAVTIEQQRAIDDIEARRAVLAPAAVPGEKTE